LAEPRPFFQKFRSWAVSRKSRSPHSATLARELKEVTLERSFNIYPTGVYVNTQAGYMLRQSTTALREEFCCAVIGKG
jgi:hypothetical protein